MVEVINITKIRNNLLKYAEQIKKENKKFIITKNDEPIAILKNINEEVDYKNNKNNCVLLIVGAKLKEEKDARNFFKNYNKLLLKEDIFSSVIFVYSTNTKFICNKINYSDIRFVNNEKIEQPFISSIKAGLTAISNFEKFFIVSFLSKFPDYDVFLKFKQSIQKTKKGILIARTKDKLTHPIAFAIKYKKILLKIRKELGIPYLLKKFKNDIEFVDI